MKTNHFVIPAELERSEALAGVKPERHTPLRAVALKLTRRGAMAAKAELANAALLAFVEILFDVDEDQNYANIDADGRILLPAPWGRNGARQWGLRNTEQRTFSLLMRRRSRTEENPLFVYDSELKNWYVGAGYSRRSALAYLKAFPITLPEWRDAWQAIRSEWARRRLGDI
jgi:hypothetical protein